MGSLKMVARNCKETSARVLPRHSESEGHQAQVLVPSLGLPFNTTLALQMPSACNIDAKLSDCPTMCILNLSPDAKIFKEADQGSTTTSTSSTPATKSTSSSSSSTLSTGTVPKATPSSNNGDKVKVFLGGNGLVLMALVAWIFM
ncbi:hypothetical protein GQ457_10G000310 [Hibiscus cannabinus]